MENTYLERINELAAKAKTVGLTPEEEAERAELRRAYLSEVRSAFRNILDHTSVKYPDGETTPLSEFKKKQ